MVDHFIDDDFRIALAIQNMEWEEGGGQGGGGDRLQHPIASSQSGQTNFQMIEEMLQDISGNPHAINALIEDALSRGMTSVAEMLASLGQSLTDEMLCNEEMMARVSNGRNVMRFGHGWILQTYLQPETKQVHPNSTSSSSGLYKDITEIPHISLEELLHGCDLETAMVTCMGGSPGWVSSYIPNEIPLLFIAHDETLEKSIPFPERSNKSRILFPQRAPSNKAYLRRNERPGGKRATPFLRVVVSSGNLYPADYSTLGNVLYVQDFKKVVSTVSVGTSSHDDINKYSSQTNDFAEYLAGFLMTIYDDRDNDLGDSDDEESSNGGRFGESWTVRKWVDEILKGGYDYSTARAILVASVPGRHYSNNEIKQTGKEEEVDDSGDLPATGLSRVADSGNVRSLYGFNKVGIGRLQTCVRDLLGIQTNGSGSSSACSSSIGSPALPRSSSAKTNSNLGVEYERSPTATAAANATPSPSWEFEYQTSSLGDLKRSFVYEFTTLAAGGEGEVALDAGDAFADKGSDDTSINEAGGTKRKRKRKDPESSGEECEGLDVPSGNLNGAIKLKAHNYDHSKGKKGIIRDAGFDAPDNYVQGNEFKSKSPTMAGDSTTTSKKKNDKIQPLGWPIKVVFPSRAHALSIRARGNRAEMSGIGSLCLGLKYYEGSSFRRDIFYECISKRWGLMHAKILLGMRSEPVVDGLKRSDIGRVEGSDNVPFTGFVYVGSHNFSPSAWGSYNGGKKEKSTDEGRGEGMVCESTKSLRITNVELGAVFGVMEDGWVVVGEEEEANVTEDEMEEKFGGAGVGRRLDGCEVGSIRRPRRRRLVRVPLQSVLLHQHPPKKYNPSDRPFMHEENHVDEEAMMALLQEMTGASLNRNGNGNRVAQTENNVEVHHHDGLDGFLSQDQEQKRIIRAMGFSLGSDDASDEGDRVRVDQGGGLQTRGSGIASGSKSTARNNNDDAAGPFRVSVRKSRMSYQRLWKPPAEKFDDDDDLAFPFGF
ncbi:hypothetical protein HDU76_000208 [Blyttiomyces sp. JEL0837]|nr:hypothetical protein HDU76_000208 [Blyttiomyces sp. JEL0837]